MVKNTLSWLRFAHLPTELPTFPKQILSVKRQSLSVLVNSIKHLYFEAIDQGGCSLYSLWSCQKLLNQDVWHFQKVLGQKMKLWILFKNRKLIQKCPVQNASTFGAKYLCQMYYIIFIYIYFVHFISNVNKILQHVKILNFYPWKLCGQERK